MAQPNAELKKNTLDSVFSILDRKYVFPEVARAIRQDLTLRHTAGEYDTITTFNGFAFQLTRQMQAISKDQHLRMSYSPAPSSKKSDTTTTAGDGRDREWELKLMKENNYGIRSKQILQGNIGYLELPVFGPLDLCRDSIAAAMQFVSGTDALIIDLRACRGSLDENTIPFFHSYFFRDSMHITDFYTRETNTTQAFWTSPSQALHKYLGPIYVITSGRTFSGGEAFAYELKHMKRATILGETTRGGANPAELERINPSFTIAVPYARSINSVTGTNWENTGVTPDTTLVTATAVYTAHLYAAKKLLNSQSTTKSKQLRRLVDSLEKNPPVLVRTRFLLPGYPAAKEVAVAGSFNSFARRNLLLKFKDGNWSGEAQVMPGPLTYMFIVDGKWINDPAVTETKEEDGRKNSYKVITR